MKYLITGGAGFIGSHLATALVRKNKTVLVIDDLSGGINNLEKNIPFEMIDILKFDFKNIFNSFKPDIVFHMANTSNPRSGFNGYMQDLQKTEKLLELSKKIKLKHFVFSSSASVYGNKNEGIQNENNVLDPLNDYAFQKMKSEELGFEYSKNNLNFTALRYFNVYGPRLSFYEQNRGIISHLLEKEKKKEALVVFGDGMQVRDFIYVDDVVMANLKASNRSGDLYQVYNVGTGAGIILKDLIKLFNIDRVYYSSRNPAEILKSVADISKIQNDLNFEIKFHIKSGIEKTKKWFEGI